MPTASKKTAGKKAVQRTAKKAVTRTATRKPAKKKVRPRARGVAGTPARQVEVPPARQFVSRRVPETLRLRSAEPSLTVSDIEASLAWYRDMLGFVVKERWEHEGRLAGVELLAGNVSFYLTQDDWKKGMNRTKGEGFRLYCTTAQTVDRLAESIRERGGDLLQEPHDEPWGGRSFAVVDPDGFKLSITSA